MLWNRVGLVFSILLFLSCVPANAAPAPAVYTLGTPISEPCSLQVDQQSRLLIVDAARQAVMRFEIDGKLDRLWYFDDTTQSYTHDSESAIRVRPDGKIYLTSSHPYRGALRLLDMDSMTCAEMPQLKEWRYKMVVGPGGDIYASGYTDDDDRSKGCCMRVYSADGRLKQTFPCCRTFNFAVDSVGRVYADDFDSKTQDDLIVYGPDGKQLRTLGTPFGFTGSMTSDPDDVVYVVKSGFPSDRILRIGANNEAYPPIIPYEQPGRSTGVGSIVARNGLIYAMTSSYVDGNKDRKWEIQVLTLGGQCVARYLPMAMKCNMPGALAVQPDGSYAVQQLGGRGVLLFHADDSPAGIIEDYNCGSIAAGPNGGYYAADAYNVSRYDSTGKKTAQIIESKVANKETHCVADSVDHIARDSNGHTWGMALGCPDPEIVEFGSDDMLIRRIQPSKEIWPSEMAIDAKRGCLYCTSWMSYDMRPSTNTITKCDLQGKRLATIGSKGSGIGELLRSNGMTVDAQGRLYVADTGNSRIQVFAPDGEPLGVWYGPSDTRLCRPVDVELGPNDTLWVSDTLNNRIVRVSLGDFWQQLTKKPQQEPAPRVIVRTPLPASGKVCVEAIVTAGTDDFSGDVYVESPDRSWGLCVTLPAGQELLRGERCKLVGALVTGPRAFAAESVEHVDRVDVPGPLGAANLYIGDGYRSSDRQVELSNLCLLVRTWGKVVSVDENAKVFVISDGSYGKNAVGMAVYFGDLRRGIEHLPKPGQYVGITGISTTWVDPTGKHIPAVRIRNDADIDVFVDM